MLTKILWRSRDQVCASLDQNVLLTYRWLTGQNALQSVDTCPNLNLNRVWSEKILKSIIHGGIAGHKKNIKNLNIQTHF